FNDEAVEQDDESLFLRLRAHPYDDLVVLDVTASQQLADQYLDFASHGFHVISANKLAGASDSNKYRQIHDAFEKTGRHWLYNARSEERRVGKEGRCRRGSGGEKKKRRKERRETE